MIVWWDIDDAMPHLRMIAVDFGSDFAQAGHVPEHHAPIEAHRHEAFGCRRILHRFDIVFVLQDRQRR